MASGVLKRLLHVRAVLQDLACAELERGMAGLDPLERTAHAQKDLSLSVREHAMRSILLPSQQAGWPVLLADAEILQWRSARLEALAAIERTRVDAKRRELIERRLERHQVEALLARAAQQQAKKEARREQNALDDWFLNTRSRKRQ